MTSTQLLNKITVVLSFINSHQSLYDVLHTLASIHAKFAAHVRSITMQTDNHQIIAFQGAAKTAILNSTHKAVRTTKFSKITKDALQLASLLSEIKISASDEAGKKIESFIDALDENFDTHNLSSSIDLVIAAHDLVISLENLESIANSLESVQPPSQDNPLLTIYLPCKTTVSSFGRKTLALAEILEICCQLLSMSVEEGDIALEKIESGSFFAKVSGHPMVITLASIVLTNGLQFAATQLSKPSEHEVLRASSETLINILKVSEFLEAQGKDSAILDEELKKASIRMLKEMSELVIGAEEVQVNDISLKIKEHNPLLVHQDHTTN